MQFTIAIRRQKQKAKIMQTPYSHDTLEALVKCLYARCHHDPAKALECLIQTDLDVIGHDLYVRGQTYDAFYLLCHQYDLLVRYAIDDLDVILEDIVCNSALSYDTRAQMLAEMARHGRHAHMHFDSRLINIELSDSLFRYACTLKDDGEMVDILKLVLSFGFVFVNAKLQVAVYDQNAVLVRVLLDHIASEHRDKTLASGFLAPVKDGFYGGIAQVYDVVSMHVATMKSCNICNDKRYFYEWACSYMHDTIRDMDTFSASCEKRIERITEEQYTPAWYEWSDGAL